MAAVQAFLEKQLGGDAYKAFAARLSPIINATANQRSTEIETFLKKGDCPPWVYPKLRFLKTFLDAVDYDLETFGWLSSKSEQASVESLAGILFPSGKLDDLLGTDQTAPKQLTTNILNRIRSRIFNGEPLVVLLSAIKTGLLSGIVSDVTGLKAVLSVLIDQALDICDPTLSERASESLPPEVDLGNQAMESAVKLAKSLKVLSRVVDDPSDILPLLKAGFSAVRQISSRNKNEFAETMQTFNLKLDTALKIHDSAERLDCWNENLWLSLIQASRKDCIPISLYTPQEQSVNDSALTIGNKLPENASGRPLNNLTDIFRLEDAACEECCSVTSLSAYFTALLKFLHDTALTKAIVVPGLNSNIPRQLETVLDILTHRRADLLNLELSCENSQTLVPYISLVNEVLESYIRFYNQKSLDSSEEMEEIIRAYQSAPGHIDEGSDDHGPLYRPVNTDYEVYQKIISPFAYPMAVFPYDLAQSIQKGTIDTWGISSVALVTIFAPPNFIAQYIPKARRKYLDPKVSSQIMIGQKEVLSRQQSSEILGISQSDFTIITGETFFPPWFADLLNGFTSKQGLVEAVCPWDAATLWGYENVEGKEGSARINLLDTKNGLGLSYIKRQLMERSQYDFQGVMDLVKTQCFSQHCIITTAQTTGIFEKSIESLRLYSNASSPPFQPLTEKLAFALQSFIRLKSKLNWTTRELDSAIFLFHNLEIEISPQSKKVKSENLNGYPASATNIDAPSPELYTISPFKLKALASLKELATLVGIKESSLLGLWGPMDAFGSTSYFHKSYMRPDLGAMSPVFSMEGLVETPHYFRVNGKPVTIGDHVEAVSYALKWPLVEVERLFKVSELDRSSELNITTFTSLYRYTILCKIFNVKPKDSTRFFQGFFADGSAASLASPQTTLQHIKKWKDLLEAGWTVDALLEVLSASNTPIETKLMDQGLKFAVRLLKAAEDVKKSSPIQLQGPVPNTNDIKDCASRLFEPATATAVTNFIEELVPIPAEILAKESAILKKVQGIGTPTVEPSPEPKKGVSKEAAAAAENEMRLRARREKFINVASEEAIKVLFQTMMVTVTKEFLPNLDAVVIPPLLSQVIQVPQDSTTVSAYAAIQYLTSHTDVVKEEPLKVYFTPETSDAYTFTYSGPARTGASAPVLSVNDIDLPFNSEDNSFTSFRFATGAQYLLKSNLSAGELLCSTSKTASKSPITGAQLIPSRVIDQAVLIYLYLRRLSNLAQKLSFKVEELNYIASNQSRVGENLIVNLQKVSLVDLCLLQKYCDYRDRCKGGAIDLLNLVSWISNIKPDHGDTASIIDKISSVLTRDKLRAADLVKLKYPETDDNAFLAIMKTFKGFLDLQASFDLDEKIALACTKASVPSIDQLYQISRPRTTLIASNDDLKITLALQKRLSVAQQTKMDEQLAEKRRRCLVEYLLRHDTIKKLNIYDADGLFDYFLTDVMMGPQLRTSRIKQAISVVQLFVQRCLLGMEDDVPKNLISRPNWEWMQQYTMWEAHRKLFLYPENWIDPSLRDDKSPLFEQFEATLMQKNLSIDTFCQATQTYVYNLNDVSGLDIVAYLHEAATKPNEVFHFFGCTRVAPRTFYYRSLTVMPEGEVFWKPWSKMDLDIPCVESEWDGKQLKDTGAYLFPVFLEGRLYLFMLQMNPKTVARPPGDSPPQFQKLQTETLATTEPIRQWELIMSWSELMKCVWAPKRLAPGSVIVNLADLPSPSQLRIDPQFQTKGVNLIISCSNGITSRFLGGFSFTRDQMISPEMTQVLFDPKYATHFGKASGERMEVVIPVFGHAVPEEPPLIWKPNGLEATPQANCRWTLSKTPEKTTGLVLNVKETDNSSTSYFNLPQLPLLVTKWTTAELQNSMKLMAIDHTSSQALMKASADRVDTLQSIYGVFSMIEQGGNAQSFGSIGGLITGGFYHELATPVALYNWELGVHNVCLAVDKLFSTQQFEEALKVARLLFDPTVDMKMKEYPDPPAPKPTPPAANLTAAEQAAATAAADAAAAKAKALLPPKRTKSPWKFPPFQYLSEHMQRYGDSPIKLNDLGKEITAAITERRSYGNLVHAAARARPQAYMKWIVMKYAEILIACGDSFFRQGTLEALPLATQKYIEAVHVLGPEPPKIPKLGKRRVATFSTLNEENTLYDLTYPFSTPIGKDAGRGSPQSAELDPKKQNITGILKTGYFCVPLNPKFKKMRTEVHVKLYNLRNSLDINGKPVTYALREPPIDMDALMSLNNSGMSISQAMGMVASENNRPLPRHRFDFLIHRAMELCMELRGLGDRFLTSIEKKESEDLNVLRARHTTVIQTISLDIKKSHLLEAEQMLNALQLSRDTQVSQLEFYLDLIGEPRSRIPSEKDKWEDVKQDVGTVTKDDLRMSEHEELEMTLADTSAGLNNVVAGLDSLAARFSALPTVSGNVAPFGIGVSISAGGSNIASVVQSVSIAMKGVSSAMAEAGQRASRKSNLIKQLQDRRMQANIRGREIKSIDQQMETQINRILTARKEIDMQVSEMEDAKQMEEWYRTKYTNSQLYSWMEKSIRNLYFQAYTLAIGVARQAEASLSFEQGQAVRILRPAGYWDASRDGLLSADNLYLDLKRLEQSQIEAKRHDFEITKTVSLRQISPRALLELRLTGKTKFSVSELQFDMDFPGHYMRRIRSIAVTIPAVVSPHSGLNATLTLMKHKYRVSPLATSADDYNDRSNNDLFHADAVPITSVAISTGSYDTGTFELNFGGSRYQPFEGAGAISDWQLELPTVVRKFDYETISDVLLHVQYTALDGGKWLQTAANGSVSNMAKAVEDVGKTQGFLAMFDLKNDFVNAWYGFSQKLLATRADPQAVVTLDLGSLKERLPFWSRRQKILSVHTISFISKSATLITNVDVPKISGGNKKSIVWQPDTIDTLNVVSLDTSNSGIDTEGWTLSVPSKVVDKNAKEVDNIQMMIRYVFADG